MRNWFVGASHARLSKLKRKHSFRRAFDEMAEGMGCPEAYGAEQANTDKKFVSRLSDKRVKHIRLTRMERLLEVQAVARLAAYEALPHRRALRPIRKRLSEVLWGFRGDSEREEYQRLRASHPELHAEFLDLDAPPRPVDPDDPIAVMLAEWAQRSEEASAAAIRRLYR